MKRELGFFIDLFIDTCKGKTKPQQKEDLMKLVKGTYNTRIGEHYAVVVLKTTNNEYAFNYVNVLERKSMAFTKATLEEIKLSFQFLLQD